MAPCVAVWLSPLEAGDGEVRDPKFLDVALEHVDLKLRLRIVDARRTGRTVGRWNIVVCDRHRCIGPADFASGELQPFEGLRGRHLMD
jgi:hypothetical protein